MPSCTRTHGPLLGTPACAARAATATAATLRDANQLTRRLVKHHVARSRGQENLERSGDEKGLKNCPCTGPSLRVQRLEQCHSALFLERYSRMQPPERRCSE